MGNQTRGNKAALLRNGFSARSSMEGAAREGWEMLADAPFSLPSSGHMGSSRRRDALGGNAYGTRLCGIRSQELVAPAFGGGFTACTGGTSGSVRRFTRRSQQRPAGAIHVASAVLGTLKSRVCSAA